MINSQTLPPQPQPIDNIPTPAQQGFVPTKQDAFSFLQKGDKSTSSQSPLSFFSQNGLSRDIIQVTHAEPDVCLEVFYALYNTLQPQIESHPDFSVKDAWTKFLGGALFKGTLCPPEKLVIEKRVRDLRKLLSTPDGEAQVFKDLDQVMNSVSNLKNKISELPGQLLHQENIRASLNLVQDFYLEYRNKVKTLVQTILEKEKMNTLFTAESDALEDLLEPKAVMMSDSFPHHWAYRISRNQARKLLSLDASGRNLQSSLNDPSNHRVIALPENTDEPLVFFKANGNPPIRPEKELMLYSLYSHLQIPVPETALLVITDVFDSSAEQFYAAQASEAVQGESPIKAYRNPDTVFDQEAYVAQAIGALLTNPSDGSFKNFKYNQEYQTFISIDNDEVFKQELIGKDEKRMANVKSILYSIPQIDLPIPESTKTFFTTLDPYVTTLSWLQDLTKKNQDYQLLFTRLTFQMTRCIYQNLLPQSQVPTLESCLQKKVLVDSEIHSASFYPQILISKELLQRFIAKLQGIEKVLHMNRAANTQALFEEISPALAKYYRKLRLEFDDIEVALEALWGVKKYNTDYSYLTSLLDYEEFKNLPNPQKEENLTPETFFKEFRDVLLVTRESALDSFIKRHNERKMKNTLNLQIALKELQFLVQENLTASQQMREIVDFCHGLSKTVENKPHLVKEITTLLSDLPDPELKWLLVLEKFFFRADRHVPKDLMSSSVSLLGAFMKKRTFILTDSELQYLFDSQGNIKKNAYLTGRSRVTCFPQKQPEFYLKQYPEWPGYEVASTLFMRLLGVKHLPYQDLLIIRNYPVLMSQKADGDPVIRLWMNSKTLSSLDPFHTGLQIICAMLINPEDGKEDNFILSPDKRFLIPIDNDHCFLPSTLQKEGSVWNAFTVNTALQTKTILFCLDEMYMEIPLEVKQHILSLNFDSLLPKWMAELDKIENKFNNLVDQNQRSKFLEQGTVMRIPFYKQFIENLHWKAHKIQDILKSTTHATPFDILKAIEPFAARCYEDSFKQGRDLHSRFTAATKNLYKKTAVDGSRMSILNTRTMMEIINVSEKELQNDVMYQRMGPIDSMEYLNKLSEERSKKVTMEQDILYELDEKKQEKKWINLFGNPAGEAALKAFFAGPQEGLILKGSKLITASKLMEMFAQASNKGMRIRFLSLPESPLLTEKEIRILAEECPNIEYLNISGCLKLKQITTREGEWALLSRLEAKDCTKLEKLESYSPVKIFQTQTQQKVEIFVSKPTLDVFSIKSESGQFEFSFKKGQGYQIRYGSFSSSSDNFGKDFLSESRWSEIQNCFREFKITLGVSLSGENLAVFVQELNCQNSLNVTYQKLITMATLNLVYLKKVDFSSSPINDGGLEVLTRGNWPFLQILNLRDTKITAKGMLVFVVQSNWPQLKHLTLSSNEIYYEGLEILAQKDWPLLQILDLEWIGITEKALLSFPPNPNWLKLKEINFESRKKDPEIDFLDEADFKKSSNSKKKAKEEPKGYNLLTKFDLSNSGITQNDIEILVKESNRPQLKSLVLSGNKISDEGLGILTQGDWPLLESLDLAKTGVTKKRLLKFVMSTNWPNLKEINVQSDTSGDNLWSFMWNLLPKNWPFVQELYMEKSEITSIEIEQIVKKFNWPQLKHIDLSGNEITDESLEILVQGDWPELRTLDLAGTSVTKKGLLKLLLNLNWPHLNYITLPVEEDSSWHFIHQILPGNWSQLDKLDLGGSGVAQNEIEEIIKKANWPLLKSLDLSGNEISDDGLEKLTQGKWPLLEILNIKEIRITSSGAENLVKKSNWPHLKRLDISENEIEEKGLGILAQANWPLLEVLNLKATKITIQEVEISQCKWPQLKRLDLSANEIKDEGLEKLAQGEWHLLESLDLAGAGVTRKALLKLLLNANWPNLNYLTLPEKDSSGQRLWQFEFYHLLPKKWAQLKCLKLENSGITSNEVERMVTKFSWPNLEYLDLSGNEINDEGFKMLIQGNWPLLQVLNLKGTKITAIGNEISQCNWSQLKRLDLSANEITDESLEVLTQGNWPLIESLDLTETNVTKKGLLKLLMTPNWSNLNEVIFNNEDFSRVLLHGLLPGNRSQLEQLDFTDAKITQNEIGIIMQCKLPQLKSLTLSSQEINDEGLEILVQANWPLLETLNLQKTKITDFGVETLVQKSNWLQLKNLGLSGNEISDKSLEVLIKGNWKFLENLDLSGTNVTREGLLKLVLNANNWSNLNQITFDDDTSSSWHLVHCLLPENCSQLERLDFSGSQIKQSEIEIITQFKLPQLKYISLSGQEISLESLRILTQGNWPLLEALHLDNTKITAEGVKVIVEKSNWPQLKTLNLSKNQIDDDSLEILSQVNWPLLETLDLTSTAVTNTGLLKPVLNANNWPNLKEIKLESNHYQEFFKNFSFLKANHLLPQHQSKHEILDFNKSRITKNEMKTLIECKLPLLKRLDLSSQDLDDEGLEILVQGNWPLLETLDLENTKITAAGVEVIVEKSNWPQLKTLNLSNNPIQDEGLETLLHGNWLLLKNLGITNTGFTRKRVLQLLLKESWPNLENLDIEWETAWNLLPGKWSQLEKLDLSDSEITRIEIELLVQKSDLAQLRYLDLSGNTIQDEGLEILAQGNWPLLEALNLKATKITNSGVEALTRRANWPKLDCLVLSENNEINDSTLEILAQGSWPLFEYLDLTCPDVTRKGIYSLALNANWPNLKQIISQSVDEKDNEKLLKFLSLSRTENLEELDLTRTGIVRDEIEMIIQMKFPQLKHLNLSNEKIKNEGLEILVQGNWPLLEILDLGSAGITAAGLKFIVEKSNWPQLKILNLSKNPIHDEGLEILSQANWPSLEYLNLKRTKISNSGVEILVKKSNFPQLKNLNLARNLVNDEGLETLIQGNWSLLEYLNLTCPGVTKKGLLTLFLNENWPNLKGAKVQRTYYGKKKFLKNLPFLKTGNHSSANQSHIDLRKKNITKSEIEVMIKDSHWSQLMHLDLSQNEIYDEGVEILASGKWQSLEDLNLSDTRITAKGIQALAGKSDWPNLRKLVLSRNGIADEGLEILVSAYWKHLEDLNLSDTGITAKGIQVLVDRNWHHLKRLSIAQNEIQDEGLEILVSADWKLLEDLNLTATKITEKGIEALVNKSDWPNLRALVLARNRVKDEGLEILPNGKWPLLEKLSLEGLWISSVVFEKMIKVADWPNLKSLDISENIWIFKTVLEPLSSKWPLLEILYFSSTMISLEDLETLVEKSSWPNLKEICIENESIDITVGSEDSDSDETEAIHKVISAKWPNIKILTKEEKDALVESETFCGVRIPKENSEKSHASMSSERNLSDTSSISSKSNDSASEDSS